MGHHISADPQLITPLEPAALPGYATTPYFVIFLLNITVLVSMSERDLNLLITFILRSGGVARSNIRAFRARAPGSNPGRSIFKAGSYKGGTHKTSYELMALAKGNLSIFFLCLKIRRLSSLGYQIFPSRSDPYPVLQNL